MLKATMHKCILHRNLDYSNYSRDTSVRYNNNKFQVWKRMGHVISRRIYIFSWPAKLVRQRRWLSISYDLMKRRNVFNVDWFRFADRYPNLLLLAIGRTSYFSRKRRSVVQVAEMVNISRKCKSYCYSHRSLSLSLFIVPFLRISMYISY